MQKPIKRPQRRGQRSSRVSRNVPSLQPVKWKYFLEHLYKWYQPEDRRLPWKGVDDPYLVWVSEVFLQQTQADRVIEFFLRFTAKFPTVESLAAASFEEALPYFKGLGFYGRLRRMLENSKAVVQMNKGQKPEFPKTIKGLESLPGIGPYTARAIASFAYGEKVIAPDTNVVRVVARFMGEFQLRMPRDKRKKMEPKDIRRVLNEQMKKWMLNNIEDFDQHYPADFSLNQVLMDFGSSICKAKRPQCNRCPLIRECSFGRDPNQFQILSQMKTTASKRFPSHFKKVVVGILIDGKKALVSRRRPDQSYAGLLEFPGGKVEEGEDLRAALQREFLEEMGIEVSVRPPFERVALHRQYTVVSFHRCRILTGVPRSMEGQEVLWIDQQDLDPKDFLPANKPIVEQLKKSRF